MLKISISKIFSILAVILFFSRVAFAQEGAASRWEAYFPSAVQAKAVQSLKREAGEKALDLRFSVNGVELAKVESIEDLVVRMGEFQKAIAESKSESVRVSLDGQTFTIERIALGEGLTGIAYAIRGQSAVLKLPQPHAIAFKAMTKESQTMMYAEALAKAGLPIAKSTATHALGLYSVKEKAPEMNLTEFLIQRKLIEIGSGEIPTVTRISETQLELAMKNPSVENLAAHVEAALKARRLFDGLKLDLGPDNLHLDMESGDLKRFVLVDLGASSEGTKLAIDEIKTFSDYLTFSEKIISRYVRSGAYATRAAHSAHHGAKCRAAF